MGEPFTRVPAWLLNSPEFTLHESAVFVALCYFQNSEGGCFPSVQRLSEVSKVGRTSVFKALEGLETKGAIARDERRNGGHQTSNYYTIHRVRQTNSENLRVHDANSAEFATRTVGVRHANANYIQEQELKENTKTCMGESFIQPIGYCENSRKVTPLKDLEVWIKKMAEGDDEND